MMKQEGIAGHSGWLAVRTLHANSEWEKLAALKVYVAMTLGP